MSDTNRSVQLQKMDRSLKLLIKEEEELYYCVAKTKALISFAVTAKLISAFVFAHAKLRLSHDAAHNKSACSLSKQNNICCIFVVAV